MSISRREFLSNTCKGTLAAYPSMLALGLLRTAPAHEFSHSGSGNGKHIIILGAGLAGMTAAYELSRLGYRCTILEARDRVGGRCWSIRTGSTHQETTGGKQTAKFDNNLYFNAGPSRIPHHHELTLHYCRELGVPVEVYNNINEATYFFSEGKGKLSNQKIRVREIHNDLRGYMSEMLVKAINQDALNTGLTKEDGQKILEYLRAEGGLNIDNLYKASDRRGYIEHPGAGNRAGRIGDPHPLADIINAGLADPDFYNVTEYVHELQMTMLQATGGMDRIATALRKKITGPIQLGAEVSGIHNITEGVKISYKQAGQAKTLVGDFCICTIPLPVLAQTENNFSSNVSRAIDFIPYISTGKIGLQFKRRFWEQDEQIYGGITRTNNDINQIFYPSNDYLSKKGILIGYYNFNDRARRTGELTYAGREKLALEKGSLIHPQYAKEFETSFSISWHKTPFSFGGWALYNEETRNTHYEALQQPDGKIYFAGEHLTYLNAWMAGAFESARKTVTDLHARVTEQRLSYPVNK